MVVICSCNYTTASRANLESGVLIGLNAWTKSELDAVIGGRMERGVALLPALRDREVSRSMTPRRARSAARSAREAIIEEDRDGAGFGDF